MGIKEMRRDDETERALSPSRRPVDYDGSEGWASRIASRTLSAGVVGAGTGFLMGVAKEQARLKWMRLMSANFAIATSCFCASQELVREVRGADPEDLVNCLLGGLASGAVLGGIQGPRRALPCALLFASVGTALQYGALKLREIRLRYYLESMPMEEAPDAESNKFFKPEVSDGIDAHARERWHWPEWFPIQQLDEEAAAKKAKERELRLRHTVDNLHKGGTSSETG